MSARRLVAFGGFVLAGVILMVFMSSRTGTLVDLEETRPGEVDHPAPEVATHNTATRPSSRPVGDEPVRVSTRVIDFGQVPISYPKRQTLFLVNERGGKISLVGQGLKEPFSADQASIYLDPHVSTGYPIVFDPSRPGTYEQHLKLVLADDNGVGEEVLILLRGRAFLSPEAAGLAVPAPPDAELRAYQAKRRAETIAKAQAEVEARKKELEAALEEDPNGTIEGDASDVTGGIAAVAGGPAGQSSKTGPRRGPLGDAATAAFNPMVGSTALAAFGVGMGDGTDINTVPAALPDGEMTPDLPPVDSGGGGTGDSPGDDNPDDGNDTPGDGGDPPSGDDTPGTGDQGEEDDQPEPGIGIFTIAPNSSLTVYSSTGPIMQQQFLMQMTPDGANFISDGRMQFPYLSMAFGQTLTMDQFGPMTGTISPDGNVVLQMTLRLYDPNGTALDLPITLSTGMVVGYSAGGRVMVHNGYPIKSTGFVKLVGITNIPLGVNSSLDKAPVILEVLGSIQL